MAVAKARRGAPKKQAVKTTAGSERREQLLVVAGELFATQGYAATTVRDIADDAGILAGSIYHYFSSKEAMLDEILRSFLVQLHGRFSAIENKAGDPRQALSDLIRLSFTSIHDTPHAVAVYQNESDNLMHVKEFSYVADYSLKIEQIWLRVLTEGQTSGVFRPDIDVKVAYLFIRDAIWSAVRWYRPGGQLQADTVAEHYLALLYGGLI
jgi:AcrR family transcriptional regulator